MLFKKSLNQPKGKPAAAIPNKADAQNNDIEISQASKSTPDVASKKVVAQSDDVVDEDREQHEGEQSQAQEQEPGIQHHHHRQQQQQSQEDDVPTDGNQEEREEREEQEEQEEQDVYVLVSEQAIAEANGKATAPAEETEAEVVAMTAAVDAAQASVIAEAENQGEESLAAAQNETLLIAAEEQDKQAENDDDDQAIEDQRNEPRYYSVPTSSGIDSVATYSGISNDELKEVRICPHITLARKL